MKNIRHRNLFLFIGFTLTAILGLICGPTSAALGGSPAAESTPRLLSANQSQLTLEMVLPEFWVVEKNLDGETCQAVVVAGYGDISQPGQPALPGRGTMIGIPPGSELTYQVVEAHMLPLPGRYNLCPTGQPAVATTPDGEIDYQGMRYERDPLGYSQDGFFPASPIEIDSTAFIRSQQIAVVRFQPFQYNPVTGELRYTIRIRVQVNFSPYSAATSSLVGTTDEGAFEALLRQSLLNYEQARNWRLQPASRTESQVTETAAAPVWYKILVDADGLYQITYAELLAAGFPVDTVDPRTIAFSDATRILVRGEEDGRFDPQDYILFYGERADSKYTVTNVYWMTWGDNPGLRFYTQDGTPDGFENVPPDFPTTLLLEEDLVYQSARPSGADLDHWYWNFIFATSASTSVDYPFSLANISTEPVNVTVSGLLRSYSATPEHHTRIYLNGYLIDEAKWPLNGEYAFSVQVPQSYLLEGDNAIRVEATLGSGTSQQILFVNRLRVDYNDQFVAEADRLIFDYDASGYWEFHLDGFTTDQLDILDITYPNTVHIYSGFEVVDQGGSYQVRFRPQISGVRRFLVTSRANWLSPLSIQADQTEGLNSIWNQADYIIIAPTEFIPAVQPLADFRAGRGLRVKVVDLQDVYDVFSGGLVDPNAIHDFIATAYASWMPPAPAYVLLVGDGHYDFKDNLGYGEPVYMPPFLGELDPWIGETASDNRYVTVSGTDILPDLFIGRLPVRSASETAGLVNKIIQYETQILAEDWNSQLLFIADNADSGGDFPSISDAAIAASVPPEYTAARVYYGITHTTIDGTRAAIQGGINQGQLIVSYVGHASPNWWAYEKLLTRDDVPLLTNLERLPFFLPMTCLEGYFINPSASPLVSGSLGEVIVRTEGRGAIASWSPTGLGIATGHDLLENSLLTSLLIADLTRIGPATVQAKLDLYTHTLIYRDLIDTYLLFGDPALNLRTLNTWFGNVYLPLVTRR